MIETEKVADGTAGEALYRFVTRQRLKTRSSHREPLSDLLVGGLEALSEESQRQMTGNQGLLRILIC